MKTCPMCQRPLWPDVQLQGKITREIYEMMRERQWATTDEIATHVYWDKADGGPLEARKTVHVLINRMNKHLRKHGMQIKGERGRGARYCLEAIR